MSEYLAKAATLLERVADENERSTYDKDATRMKVATAYAMLAAIDKGLMPEPVAEQVYGQFRSLAMP